MAQDKYFWFSDEPALISGRPPSVDSKESASDGAAAEGASEKSHEKAASKDKLAAADVQSPVAGSEPELPPLPAVEDIGDMEV